MNWSVSQLYLIDRKVKLILFLVAVILLSVFLVFWNRAEKFIHFQKQLLLKAEQ